LVKVFIESHEITPAEIVLDVDATDLPLHGKQEGRFFHGYYNSYCYLPLYVFSAVSTFCAPGCGKPTAMPPPAACKRCNASWRRYGRRGRK
jgi:uracil-DNA glycosylase